MDEKRNKDVPTHLGIIMDGNRRWAKGKGLPTLEGHRRGLYDALIPILRTCWDKGIKIVTLYAFSTENWNRSEKEIGYLMKLFEILISERLEEAHKDGIRINTIGRLQDFPKNIQDLATKAMEKTKNNTRGILNIGLSYGGRAEIVDATKRIIESGLKPEEITEDKFREFLYEKGQPDIDLIIRTSGEYRISNFMLWQAAYSELYFTNVYWPDFDENELEKALDFYSNRDRRFGN